MMEISHPHIELVCNEQDIYEALPLDGARVLDLGCGKAEKTRLLAQGGRVASILALEVDAIQHAKNRLILDLPNVRFELGGAEQIPADDASFDIVFLFRSLHHVPVENMNQALAEIHRVLAPGGLAYVSEPIFAGEYNEILRLFHNEERVREAAFSALKRAVDSGRFQLVRQIFFQTIVRFADFLQFEENVLKVTHTSHQLSPELYARVRTKFSEHSTDKGATFHTPIRVDLLQKVS
jgi:ubiquinone/menaquinone biosynthesis C-methylase UbiE